TLPALKSGMQPFVAYATKGCRALSALLLVAMLFAGVVSAWSPQVAVLDFKEKNMAFGDDDWTVGLGDFVELAFRAP
ncbi:MAG: hypothetical protein MUC91_09645, partial [Verrucomicrobia bacterium]|nr:hypothetical protein [Verrucomicrobiota bacterium]